MSHVPPSPLCAVEWANCSRPRRVTSPRKVILSVDIASFLVRKQVPMITSLFVHICLHVTYTNVILENYRIATFLFMKCVYIPAASVVARWGLEWPGDIFMSHKDIWTCMRTHKTHLNDPTILFSWTRHTTQATSVCSLHRTYLSWECVRHKSLCSRIRRIQIEPTRF
jgi:hypothetical protein